MSADEDKIADDSGSPQAKPGKEALVQCKGFRCLARLGKDGKWRDEHGNILEVLEIVTEFP